MNFKPNMLNTGLAVIGLLVPLLFVIFMPVQGAEKEIFLPLDITFPYAILLAVTEYLVGSVLASKE